jgi:adenosylmethionine-8-amino-7-oxononanoate aminotransferase
LRQWDLDHVWHPFTQMQTYAGENAPIIAAADGFEVIDTSGRRYLDGTSSLWCNVHGHRVPEIDAAIRDQLDRVAHSTLLGLANVPSIELAAELVRRAPSGLNHVFYSDDGSTAVEAALKIVYQYHRQRTDGRASERSLFVRLTGAYHGDTIGAVSVGGIDAFHAAYRKLLFPSVDVPSPAAGVRPAGVSADEYVASAFERLESVVHEFADQIAGFVIEPLVQAAAGMLVHPRGYLTRVRELTRELGIPLIADEVAVGFGRTGRMFACEHEAVLPDVMCLSKGLTGGYLPLAATLVTTPIYESFLGDAASMRTFFHGHTFTGNPLACAAALASIRLFDSRSVLDNVAKTSAVLSERLSRWLGHPHVSDVRQCGLMAAIDLAADGPGRVPFERREQMGRRVMLAARERGVIIRPLGDTVVLMPAPAMPVELVHRLCDVVDQGIDSVLRSSR